MQVRVEARYDAGMFESMDQEEVKDFFEMIPEAVHLTRNEPEHDTPRQRVPAKWTAER